MAHYTFMSELNANNFYQRNCVDLKPVPIIRFIFQFGFWIVWDPSGFSILKCPPLFVSLYIIMLALFCMNMVKLQ